MQFGSHFLAPKSEVFGMATFFRPFPPSKNGQMKFGHIFDTFLTQKKRPNAIWEPFFGPKKRPNEIWTQFFGHILDQNLVSNLSKRGFPKCKMGDAILEQNHPPFYELRVRFGQILTRKWAKKCPESWTFFHPIFDPKFGPFFDPFFTPFLTPILDPKNDPIFRRFLPPK